MLAHSTYKHFSQIKEKNTKEESLFGYKVVVFSSCTILAPIPVFSVSPATRNSHDHGASRVFPVTYYKDYFKQPFPL